VIIKFSFGYLYNLSVEEDRESESKSVIIPIRPMNIREMRIHFEDADNKGVRLIERPTVPKAEKQSKTILNKPNCPSIRKMANDPRPMRSNDMRMIEKALLTEYS
jgi:hypothetical protein